MNLTEVFARKIEMETKIHDAVIEFENYTGLRVNKVGVERIVVECTSRDKKEMFVCSGGVAVSTEVKL